MIAYATEKCNNVRRTMDFYLNRNTEDESFSEIGKHLAICGSCREEWKGRLSLKNKLKSAVNRDFAPQSLFDLIRRQIREQR